ncbi:MAG: hypothetical protein ACK5W5_09490 [Cyanobacteriota bacterium]
MPRKSIALCLATTGLVTSLAGCNPGREEGEQGGDAMKSAPAGQSVQPSKDNGEKEREEGEGGEGGEGGDGGEG